LQYKTKGLLIGNSPRAGLLYLVVLGLGSYQPLCIRIIVIKIFEASYSFTVPRMNVKALLRNKSCGEDITRCDVFVVRLVAL